jgi:CHAD domain-containing protein
MTELDHEATVADVIKSALTNSVRRLVEHEEGVTAGGDPEDVHQARVATRRMRSDLRTFRDFLDPEWTADLRAELEWLGGELGEVRDVEVMLERLRSDARQLPGSEHEGAERVIRRLIADWHGARARIVETLATRRYRALRARLTEASSHPRVTPWALLRARDALPAVVRKPWKQLRKEVDGLGDTPADEALHAVRIRAKRARYAAESTITVFGKPARRFARAAEGVQEVLGEHQDAVVAQAWLTKTAGECSAPEAFAAGMMAAIEANAGHRARAEFPDVWASARRPELRAWL